MKIRIVYVRSTSAMVSKMVLWAILTFGFQLMLLKVDVMGAINLIASVVAALVVETCYATIQYNAYLKQCPRADDSPTASQRK